MDLRTDGQGFREDENRYRRLDEHSGIGRVQDYKVLLQDGFRYEGDKSGGSGLCTATEVLHLQVEGGTGTHLV